jgi:hypothetical protein
MAKDQSPLFPDRGNPFGDLVVEVALPANYFFHPQQPPVLSKHNFAFLLFCTYGKKGSPRYQNVD